VGKHLARTLALSGDIFPAESLYHWGLISKLCEPERLMDEAFQLAKSILSRGPIALAKAKAAINKGYDLNMTEGLALEAELFSQTFTTADQKEGVRAFLEKRPPKFAGN
jgi:enoyl-CoA hydratase